MAMLRFEVPDGDMCNGCQFIKYGSLSDGEICHDCKIFGGRLHRKYPSDGKVNIFKCSQCLNFIYPQPQKSLSQNLEEIAYILKHP